MKPNNDYANLVLHLDELPITQVKTVMFIPNQFKETLREG